MGSLLICSGGMDSTTLLYQRKSEIKLALSFDYGQKHAKELLYAKKNCEILGINHHVIGLKFLGSLLKSTLLQADNPVPDGTYADEVMRKTVVPFRNGIMLSIAVGVAESNELDTVLLATHAGDHFIYPDCRPEFNEYFARAVKAGTFMKLTLEAPYQDIDKRAIGIIGRDLGIDFGSMTWTCYKGGEKHCGTCGSCDERAYALEGFDTTEYLQ